MGGETGEVIARATTREIIKLENGGVEQKTKRGRPLKTDNIQIVGKREGSLNSFIKQMQKNKSDSEESDIEAEQVMDGYEVEEIRG